MLMQKEYFGTPVIAVCNYAKSCVNFSSFDHERLQALIQNIGPEMFLTLKILTSREYEMQAL